MVFGVDMCGHVWIYLDLLGFEEPARNVSYFLLVTSCDSAKFIDTEVVSALSPVLSSWVVLQGLNQQLGLVHVVRKDRSLGESNLAMGNPM